MRDVVIRKLDDFFTVLGDTGLLILFLKASQSGENEEIVAWKYARNLPFKKPFVFM